MSTATLRIDIAPVEPWGNDPNYPVSDWKYEVQNDDTRLGYADWRLNQIENEEEDT